MDPGCWDEGTFTLTVLLMDGEHIITFHDRSIFWHCTSSLLFIHTLLVPLTLLYICHNVPLHKDLYFVKTIARVMVELAFVTPLTVYEYPQ